MGLSQIKEVKLALDNEFTSKLPYPAAVLLVDTYDGLADTCYLQFGPGNVLTRQEIVHHKAFGWEGEKQVWIVNTAGQAGKTLKISIGGVGASLSAGTNAASSGDATEAKQDDIITELGLIKDKFGNLASLAHGQTTVGVTEVVLASTHAVPNGFAVVVKALGVNTGKIFVGLTGLTISTGFELSAGESVALYVADVVTVYLISDTAAQGVSYIVESA